ncbi:MAG: hypothetical protein KA974_08470 [Saprospiraceae bacterium]|nr:hypothetical protein [Saprospiraceae bacterium]MBP7699190.1 hypothetical protein [Saprospiraceae bacterium]
MKNIKYFYSIACLLLTQQLFAQVQNGLQVPYETCTSCLTNNPIYSGTTNYFTQPN